MQITSQRLIEMGFRPAGVVVPDAAQVLRVRVDRDMPGYGVYAMLVGEDVKKFGTTGRKNSCFKSRMSSTFSALRQVIRRGPPFTGDPFKRFAPAPILRGETIQLWLKPSSADTFEVEETELNNRFRPEWTKEGCRTMSNTSEQSA